jgi:AraC-like DNA-binding protein
LTLDVYVERSARLPGAIVWSRTVPADGALAPVLPDGCVDLLWSAGQLMIAGPDTAAHSSAAESGAVFAGVRFAPGTGPSIIGVRGDEIRARRVPLDSVLGTAMYRWAIDIVAPAAHSRAGRPALEAALESVAAEWFRLAPPPDPTMTGIVAHLRSGASVAATADAVGIGLRALHRRCLPALGYGPKTLAKILRLNRALDLARVGTPLATVAATAGYADQAHLSREVRTLTGVPLRRLLGLPTQADDSPPGNEAKSSTLFPSGSTIIA